MGDLVRKLIGYICTGGTAAIVDAGGFAGFIYLGMPVVTAAATSFCLAVALNYQLTSRFVFRRSPTSRGFVLFLVVAAIGLTTNVGTTILVATSLGIAPVLAKLTGIGVAFSLNFCLNVCIVFRGGARSPIYRTDWRCL